MLYTLCIALTGAYVLWRGQDINWDLLNYHYYQGYSLINGRLFTDIAAAGLQSFLNPTLNVIAYISIKHFKFPISSWIFLLIQLSSIPAVLMLAKEVGIKLGYSKKFGSSIPAVTICLLSPLWISELGTTFFSSWTAPLIIWGIYLLFISKKKFEFCKKRIIISGVLFGLATGFKLTNAPFALSALFMIVVMFHGDDLKITIIRITYFIVGCSAGFAITAWWNIYLWWMWKNPVFPLYNAIFKSEYFDSLNFRDERWKFESILDFMLFVLNTITSTNKTSENFFSDARYLSIMILMTIALFIKPTRKLEITLVAFLIFIISSITLWSLIFAYQRYLIPIELLLGLAIWILVVCIVQAEWLRKIIMICSLCSCIILIKIPDWGHLPAVNNRNNPLLVEIDNKIAKTPARYVLLGAPISYLLPSLHAESIFYGIGMSTQVDNLIFKKLKEVSDLPLRFLVKDHDAFMVVSLLQRIDFDPKKNALDCDYIRTGIDRYIICEVSTRNVNKSNVFVDIDFTPNGHMKFGGILWERGLSYWESWGRWSNSEQVELGLAGCLPQGQLKISIEGRAFGPNTEKPIKITLGNHALFFKFTNQISTQVHQISNISDCINKIIIYIPIPVSPLELGIGSDTRKIGLGLTKFKILKESP